MLLAGAIDKPDSYYPINICSRHVAVDTGPAFRAANHLADAREEARPKSRLIST